jgi:uncharacterized protein (DUF2336 family)
MAAVIHEQSIWRIWRTPIKSSMTADLGLLNEIEGAIANGSVSRRGKMLRHVTDLFIVGSAQCTDQEVALFDDVFIRLAVEIELSARALLAARLAPIHNAPPNIIRTLAFDDEIDVAAPVLEQSERLDDRSLVDNAKEKSQAHLLAISRRRSLSEAVTDVLVERGDQQVALSTVENRGARFSDAGFTMLVRRSDGDDSLAACVGSRPEIPPRLFLKVLAKASESVRRKLEAAHPSARHEVRRVVAEVTGRIGDQVLDRAPDYVAARGFVDALFRSGQLNDDKLRAIAKIGRIEEIAAALALLSELPLKFVERAMAHERAETVLIIAKAIGLSWSTVDALLSVRERGRSSPVSEIAQCLASFERLKPATAREIVRFYRMRERADAKQPN